MRAANHDSVERARLLAALWERPVVSDREAAQMIGLPRSTWAALKRSAGFPAQFSLGRRVFFRVEDLRAWLDAKALAANQNARRRLSHQHRACRSTPAATHHRSPAVSSTQTEGEIL